MAEPTRNIERPLVGEAAPDVSMRTAEGSPWRLSDHGGRSVVLIFHRHIH